MTNSQIFKDADKLRKILKRPHGAAALDTVLKELAAEERAVYQRTVPGDMPIVAILVPSYRCPNPRMQSKLLEMKKYTEAQGKAMCIGMPLMRNSVVHWQRNDLITELIKSQRPFTHIFFIDDDIVPEQDHLVKLLSHNVDIVAGLCTFRQDPPVPNARFYDQKSMRYAEMRDWSQDGLIEVDAVGTGMILISREALQKVANVWFECKAEQALYGVSDEWVTKASEVRTKAFDESPNAFWFEFHKTPDYGVKEFGEDISFCFKAKQYAGLKIWVDTTVNPEHIGEYGFTITDYKSGRKYARELAESEGRMVVAPDSRVLEGSEKEPLKISILVPTRGRPENCERLLKSIKETAEEFPEIVFYKDDDDETPVGIIDKLPIPLIKVVRGPRITLSQCWNECAKVATGDILMMGSDDIEFQTKNWDVIAKNAFRGVPDKIIFAHGDDGHWGKQFGTHGMVHRKWMETVGYFVPPYFSSDWCDTWLNEVANALVRRVYLPMKTEHHHPLFGKAKWDKTHLERLERHKADKVDELYASKAAERQTDVEKLRAVIEAAKTPPDTTTTTQHNDGVKKEELVSA